MKLILRYTSSLLTNIGRSMNRAENRLPTETFQKAKDLEILKPFRGVRAGKGKTWIIPSVSKTLHKYKWWNTNVTGENASELQWCHGKQLGCNRSNLKDIQLVTNDALMNIPVIVTTREMLDKTSTPANHDNLVHIQTVPQSKPPQIRPLLDFCVLNARSINNKAHTIKDFVVDNNLDVLAITETWLQSNGSESFIEAELCPAGYKFKHISRGSRGGGIGLLYKQSLNVKSKSCKKYQSFEHSLYTLDCSSKKFLICVVYRPPPSKKNKLTFHKFMAEFSTLLEHILIAPGDLVLTGDFNIHFEKANDPEAIRFRDLIDSCNLTQHVREATHLKGHLLDLLVTRTSENTVDCVKLSDPGISDHSAVHFKLMKEKPSYEKKVITFRKLKNVDPTIFQKDIQSTMLNTSRTTDVSEEVDQYNTILSQLVDKHAPVKERVVTIRPSAPWYTDEIKTEKHFRRKLERKWRSSKLTIDRELYMGQCKKVTKMIDEARRKHYNGEIMGCSNDQKALFGIVDKLLHRNSEPLLPSHDSPHELANRFADFFADKILKIRSDLEFIKSEKDDLHIPQKTTHKPKKLLNHFPRASEAEVLKLIKASPSKSCSLDPMPTWLLKDCIGALLPTITKIVNLSLSSCVMPSQLKNAILSPLLKKMSLDSEILKNFRPVSNLAFISKLIEKVVAARTMTQIVDCHLHELFQSAYRKYHSTETALARVQNDILQCLDGKSAILLVLLDLSAAFDTIDHEILLSILSSRLGITGNALAWFKSYLSQRFQTVNINGAKSVSQELKFGVPQGSVLGPILFTIYMLPLGDILRSHNVQFHQYADDTQLYLRFDPTSDCSTEDCKLVMQRCIEDVRKWMAQNMLKLNNDKTEVLLIGADSKSSCSFGSLQVGSDLIETSKTARNIGVIFDSEMKLETHVKNVAKNASYHIRNIGRIRKFLTKEAAEILVHAFISSRLDYCNALLYGIPITTLSKLQLVQNTAARVVTGTTKHEHITPVLKSLHWLPVIQRIQFKILLMTFKCLHGLAPAYLGELIEQYCPVRNLRSQDEQLLVVPKSRLRRYGDRAFYMAAPQLWNALPCALRKSSSVESFKTKLKTYLFKQVYG